VSALSVLDALAEARIEEAMREGAFDDLPGMGRPLTLDDDRLVPEHLRAAYRILRNAGFVPPEVEARRERARLATLLATLDDDAARRRALAKLALVEAALQASGLTLRVERKLAERFGRSLG
jgi:DnaJ-like protein